MTANALINARQAMRHIFKAPKFAVLTLVVLVGGLSVSLYTFSFLYTLVYADIPLPDGNSMRRIVVAGGGDYGNVPTYEFQATRDQLQSFSELGTFHDTTVRLTIGDQAQNLPAYYVEPGIFRFARTEPLMGRELSEEDMGPGAPPVTVISHETWQNQLSGKTDVLGTVIELNGQSTTVVGVMPPGFRFPLVGHVWLPMPDRLARVSAETESHVPVYARLKPGVSVDAARRELGETVNRLYQENVKRFDKLDGELDFDVVTFQRAQTDGGGTVIFIVFNLIALFILLLACINVGNLLLARAIARQRETAIRAALGAEPIRLIAMLMWEGLLITFFGALLSILLVGAALDYTDMVMHSFLPNGIAFWWHWGMNGPTLLMAIVFASITLLLSALVPAWRATRVDINQTLRDGTRGAQGLKAGRLSRLLVTAQIFLIATLMLIGSVAGFVFGKMTHFDTGETWTNVLRADIDIPAGKYPTPRDRIAFHHQLLSNVAVREEITGAVVRQYQGHRDLEIAGLDNDGYKPTADVITIMGQTDTLGIRLMSGRPLDRSDHDNSAPAALISDSMAQRYWSGETPSKSPPESPRTSPLGQRIKVTIGDQTEWVTVVGTVSNRINSVSMFSPKDADDELYLSGYQFHGRFQDLFFAHNGDAKAAEDQFFEEFSRLDGALEVPFAVPADRNLNRLRQMMKVSSQMTFAAGGFALLLALAGIYGLTQSAVAQRTHETGIRRAIGAPDGQIIKLFLRQGAGQLILGLGLALVFYGLCSVLFHGFAEGLLPVTLYGWLAVAVSLGLAVVVMTAIYIPTRRAVALEPGVALRYE